MEPGSASMHMLPTVIRYPRLKEQGYNVMQFWQFQALRSAWIMICHFPDD
jgi:hypothetical protein